MKNSCCKNNLCLILLVVNLITTLQVSAQGLSNRWQFGGAVAIAFSNNFSNVMAAPGVLYHLNEYAGIGAAAQINYMTAENAFDQTMYGGSAIAIVNVSQQLQLSGEIEQLRVQLSRQILPTENTTDQFWNTALFVGLGYRSGPVTAGIRYNLLHDNEQQIYNTAYMPFVRLYF